MESKKMEKLTEIIREYTGDPALAISEDTVLIKDLEMSSLDLMTLVCDVEEAFGIEIPDRAIRDIQTIGDFMRFLEEQ